MCVVSTTHIRFAVNSYVWSAGDIEAHASSQGPVEDPKYSSQSFPGLSTFVKGNLTIFGTGIGLSKRTVLEQDENRNVTKCLSRHLGIRKLLTQSDWVHSRQQPAAVSSCSLVAQRPTIRQAA
jgi:hypothetical protein